MQSEVSQDEIQVRLDALLARRARLVEVKTKVRKVNAALANLAVAPVTKQIGLIRSAQAYVADIKEIPTGVKPLLRTIHNELQSLHEGILAKAVRKKDLVLTAGVQVVREIDAILAKVESNLVKLSSSLEDVDRNVLVLKKNQEQRDKIPAFNGREFVVGRAPVAFTFQNKQKHSSVGYVDQEKLDNMGFKSDNLGGYTVIHNQLVIGIDSHAVYDKQVGEDGKQSIKRQQVKDTTVVFKKGNPTRVLKARDKLHIDVARKVLKMLERRFNAQFDFVSEYAVGLNGGEFFWVMSVQDFRRLAKAFPGGHLKISRWGFAF